MQIIMVLDFMGGRSMVMVQVFFVVMEFVIMGKHVHLVLEIAVFALLLALAEEALEAGAEGEEEALLAVELKQQS